MNANQTTDKPAMHELPSEAAVQCSAWLAAIVELKNKAEEKRKSPTTSVPADYWEGRRDGLNDAIRVIQDSMAANDKSSHAGTGR